MVPVSPGEPAPPTSPPELRPPDVVPVSPGEPAPPTSPPELRPPNVPGRPGEPAPPTSPPERPPDTPTPPGRIVAPPVARPSMPATRGRGSREPADVERNQRRAGDRPDFDDVTTIKAPDGEYPRVIQYDQMVRVKYDIDTGAERVESIAPIENVAIVETDLTPPVPQQRYAGQAKIVPVGDGEAVKTQTVSERQKLASRFRHPLLTQGNESAAPVPMVMIDAPVVAPPTAVGRGSQRQPGQRQPRPTYGPPPKQGKGKAKAGGHPFLSKRELRGGR
ncbi:MAG: hypothetical protein F4W95_06640 [Chloroflexi bacterium]|nr:hypothetical protein [Chloroflexota bacterium]